MSDIEKTKQSEELVSRSTDAVNVVGRLAAIGSGIACIGTGLYLALNHGESSLMQIVLTAGGGLFALGINGKFFGASK